MLNFMSFDRREEAIEERCRTALLTIDAEALSHERIVHARASQACQDAAHLAMRYTRSFNGCLKSIPEVYRAKKHRTFDVGNIGIYQGFILRALLKISQ